MKTTLEQVDQFKGPHLMAMVRTILLGNKKAFITLDLDYTYPKPALGQMILSIPLAEYNRIGGAEVNTECDIKIITKGQAVREALATRTGKISKSKKQLEELYGVVVNMPYEKLAYEAHTEVRVCINLQKTWRAKMSWWSLVEDQKP